MSRRPSESPPTGGSNIPFPGLPASTDTRVAWAPAKVNLHLEVLGKRPDGFHAIETLILAVDLFDTLELRRTPSSVIELTCEPDTLPNGPGNLVWKAAEALRIATGTTQGATIRLTKRIPHEAGLGGGSSDAATTLAALNELWNRNQTVGQLNAIAATIGSDVGFFLCPPAAWCTGRGEVVEPVTVGGEFQLVLVKPPVGCPTAEVYRRVLVPTQPKSGEAARDALATGDAERLAHCLHNRLQAAAFALRPEVEAVHTRLSGCRPLACLLSGSGSSVFALGRDRADTVRIAREYIRFCEPDGLSDRVFVVRSVRLP